MNQLVVIIMGIIITGVFIGLFNWQGKANRYKYQEGKKEIG